MQANVLSQKENGAHILDSPQITASQNKENYVNEARAHVMLFGLAYIFLI